MLSVSCDAVPSGALVREATSRIETRTPRGPGPRMMMVWHVHVMRQLCVVAAVLHVLEHLGSEGLFPPPVGGLLHNAGGHAVLEKRGGPMRTGI